MGVSNKRQTGSIHTNKLSHELIQGIPKSVKSDYDTEFKNKVITIGMHIILIESLVPFINQAAKEQSKGLIRPLRKD